MKFRVYGVPAPQGSKTAFVRNGKAVVVDGASKVGREQLSSWRAEVAREAQNMRPDDLMLGPLAIDIRFYMPKPKSAPRNKHWCDKKPDIDKLIRSTLDAMTGVVFRDDGQVCMLSVSKEYAENDDPAGADINVTPVSSIMPLSS